MWGGGAGRNQIGDDQSQQGGVEEIRLTLTPRLPPRETQKEGKPRM